MDATALYNERQLASLVELDNPLSLAAMLGVDPGLPQNQPILHEVLTALLTMSGQHASALVLEPEWGLPLYTHWSQSTSVTPMPKLVLRVDAPQALPSATALPTFSDTWGVENIKNNYAMAMLELYYHPQEALAMEKKKLVAEIFDFCQTQGVPFLLKLCCQDPQAPATVPAEIIEAQLRAIQELRSTTHMLALETWGDALTTATITAELDVPWLAMATPGQTADHFTEAVHQALDNGAQGFLAGNTLWSEVAQLKRPDQGVDIDQVKIFINTTFHERLVTLNQILAETSRT